MNHKETVAVLKSAGTAQNRKIYGRHGVTRKMYGVSFAELGKLQKRIKCDQALAESLWATGNHDACILGLMVLDPETTKSSQWDAWVKELDSYVLADTFSKALHKKAVAAAKRIGTVEVDHGETGCQTPSAIPYMKKTWARKDAKKKG